MSLSTYYLNQRISILQSEINAITGGGGGGVPTSSDLADVLLNGNSAGVTDINMNLQDILAVSNINAVTINSGAGTLTLPSVVAFTNAVAPTCVANPQNPTELCNKQYVDSQSVLTAYQLYFNYSVPYTVPSGATYSSLSSTQVATPTTVAWTTNSTAAVFLGGFFNLLSTLDITSIPAGVWTLLAFANLNTVAGQGRVGFFYTIIGTASSGAETILYTSPASLLLNTVTPLIGSVSVQGTVPLIPLTGYTGLGIKLFIQSNTATVTSGSVIYQTPSAYSSILTSVLPISAITTITQVLTAGNNALDVTQTFSATGSPTTTNIDDAEVEIIDGTNGINSKLEYDRLTLAGNYAFYNTSNVVSNTGMVTTTTDTLNNFNYLTNATYTDLNIQRQIQSTFINETTGANFADGIFYQTNDTFTSPLDNTKLSLKASSTSGTITCYNPTTSTSAPLDFQASALTLNGSPIASPTPDLNAVLLVGANAGGQNITGLNNVDLVSINSTIYPPPTPSWGDTLNVSATANQDINLNNNNINSVNNINLNTINGLSPTTIGLNWGDFTGSNAYANLPSQQYQVFSFPYTTNQTNSYFSSFDANANATSYLYASQLIFQDGGSGTSTTYTSNSIQSTNGTDFTITAGTGASTALRLDCSQLIINGSAYPPAIPTIRPLFFNNGSNGFSVSSGSWANQGTIYTFNFPLANQAYMMSVNFSLYTDSFENSGAMYVDFNNSNGTYAPSTYSASRPVAQTGNNSVFNTSGSSQFVFNDWVSFTTDNNSQLIMEFYLGHNGGTWSGNYYWSLVANVLSP